MKIEGIAYILNKKNIDTDTIIPARYLTNNDPQKLKNYLFDGLNFETGSEENKILFAAANFGCGSSREHAVWALLGDGFKTVVAPSFSRIFYRNAVNNRLILIESENALKSVQKGDTITIDTEEGKLYSNDKLITDFLPHDDYMKSIITSGINLKSKKEIQISRAVTELKNGGVVLLPSDGLYALLADMKHKKAVDKIYELKKRPRNKPLQICASKDEVTDYAVTNGTADKLIKECWPGHVSFVLPIKQVDGKPVVPDYVTQNSVSLFWQENEFLKGVYEHVKSFVATSANVAGGPTPYKLNQVPPEILNHVDYVIDDGECKINASNTIIDISDKEMKVIRESAVKISDLESILSFGKVTDGPRIKINDNYEKLTIFDTTLRDGEQCAGGGLSAEQKLKIALELKGLGVDVIEAGFPISSPEDQTAISLIAKEVKGPIIAALSRCTRKDIDKCRQVLKYAERKRLHLFISTSDIHIKSKLNKTRREVLEMARESIEYAKNIFSDIQFSCEDSTRTGLDFLLEIVRVAVDAGAKTVNFADTVGYIQPDEFINMITAIRSIVPDDIPVGVHCHNDLGLAVANSLAAVKAGARHVECTVNGLGERGGNASLEEFVMNIHTRGDIYKVRTGINTRRFGPVSKLVAQETGFPVQYNKAIVGRNAFAHQSGIHQHGVIENKLTYEIIDPETVGWNSERIVLGRHSGRHGISHICNQLGYKLNDSQLQALADEIKNKIRFEASTEELEILINNTLENGKLL